MLSVILIIYFLNFLKYNLFYTWNMFYPLWSCCATICSYRAAVPVLAVVVVAAVAVVPP